MTRLLTALVSSIAALTAAAFPVLGPVGPAAARPAQDSRALPSFTDVSTTWQASCATTPGGRGSGYRVWCWGSNGWGALGPEGTNGVVPSPQRIAGRWVQLENAVGVSCGVRTRGRGYCWGRNDMGQLARPVSGYSQPRPQRVPGRWREIRTDGATTCGIRTSGALYCWGHDNNGQAGGVDTLYVIEPKRLGRGFTSVTPGATSCAIRRDASAWCWGRGDQNQLANGNNTSTGVPQRIPGRWRTVAVDGGTGCGVRPSGRAACWAPGPKRARKPEKDISIKFSQLRSTQPRKALP